MKTVAHGVVAADKSLDAQISLGGGVLLQVTGVMTLRVGGQPCGPLGTWWGTLDCSPTSSVGKHRLAEWK